MSVFHKEKYQNALKKYYREHFGERESDYFFEQPAVNVWVFLREGEIITLKSHIISGEVTHRIEEGGQK